MNTSGPDSNAIAEDLRYELICPLSRSADRGTWAARDVWTGQAVILKTDRDVTLRREAGILLELPPGIGPCVRDVLWRGSGRLLVVLERLPGRTLTEAELAPDVAPPVVRAFAQCLAHLHRAGFVHADLSPRNLLLLDSPARTCTDEPDVRLLDFGYARRRAAGIDAHAGGTPPFVAPEVVRGWMVDERADQYALGMVVRELFPTLAPGARWAPILDRLCHPRPGRRYPHMIALRDDLEQTFGLSPSRFRWPPFGGGPLRGRTALLEKVAKLIESPNPARILLFSRRGLGLSRFLLEAALRAADGDSPPLRVIDVGDLWADGGDGWELAGRIEDRARSQEALLCALPDPSARGRWLPPGQAEALRAVFARPGWQRLDLPPLDAAAFTEIVAGSLESGGDLSEPLASRLLRESDGDLRCSAELFRAQVQLRGSESGPSWFIVPALVQDASQRGSPPVPEAALPALSPAELTALRILARAGRTFPRSLAEPLLAQFADPSILANLISDALLIAEPTDHLAFITGALWRCALNTEGPDAFDTATIDRWLNEQAHPEPDRADEVLFAAQRARRLGDPRREAERLASALAWAERTRSWGHVGALLAYPHDPPLRWSRERALQQLEALGHLLGRPWNVGRLALLAANALQFAEPRTSTELMELTAQGPDPHARSAALVSLAERAQRERDASVFEGHLATLERLAQEGAGPPPGVIDYLHGLAARARGDTDEAARHLEHAVGLLHGTGLPGEFYSLQVLAVLRFGRDPAEGIRLLNAALAAGPGPEHEAQLRANLSIMYSQTGDEEAAARCIEEGLGRLHGRASPMRLANLRLQLAWSRAESDHIDLALREASTMLDTSAVRTSRFLRTGVRLLIGFCHLHQGHAQAAVSETARAWRDCLAGRLIDGVSECLRQLIDVLLDFEAWDAAGELSDELLPDPADGIRLEPAAAARLAGLRAQIEGRPDIALERLTAHLAQARAGSDACAVARYLHHLGLAQMAGGDRSGATAAVRWFEEELSVLGERGRTYYRGRARYCLARACAASGQLEQARAALEETAHLARQAGCKGLLADTLKIRLQLRRVARKD